MCDGHTFVTIYLRLEHPTKGDVRLMKHYDLSSPYFVLKFCTTFCEKLHALNAIIMGCFDFIFKSHTEVLR